MSDDASINVTTIAEFLAERGLMRQKLPERVELTDSLPRNDAGKVDKRALRQRFVENSSAASRLVERRGRQRQVGVEDGQ